MINAVIDVSHHQGRLSFRLCNQGGVLGVIHKATQGTTYTDPMMRVNKQKILEAGLLFGCYHFGSYGNGAIQAAWFLDTVRPDDSTLLVLDYEPNHSAQTTMTLEQAREFVEHIAAKTGRYPGFYSGSLIKEQLRNKPIDTVLSQCWLWIAQYGPLVKNLPPTWPTWTMWQYTDGAVGPEPHSVPGIGYVDRDKFNGDEAGLRRLWKA